MIQFDVQTLFSLVAYSVTVVGVLEYLKGFFKPLPTWVSRGLLLPVCAGVAWAAGGDVFQVATNGLALVAISQIGYPVLIQLPSAMIDKFRKSLG